MGVMICLSQGGLRSPSASSLLCFIYKHLTSTHGKYMVVKYCTLKIAGTQLVKIDIRHKWGLINLGVIRDKVKVTAAKNRKGIV